MPRKRHAMLPKGMSDALMTVHAKHPFPDTPDEIAATAAQVRDPNFRVQVSRSGVHVYNRDGLRLGQGAFELWPQLGLEDDAGARLLHGRGTGTCRDRLASSASATCRTSRSTGAARSTAASRGPGRWCAPGTTRAAREDDAGTPDDERR